MTTFIKAGFWEKLCQKCTGYKGWLNLDQFVESKIPTPTYKVFSALLTQSGGDNTQYINWDDNPNTLTIGVTYTITANNDNTNFVIAGAPNNNVGTSFIATSQTVGWNTHSQGNNQVSYNTGAPVANVLENTIGNIWFIYDGVGGYSIYSTEPIFIHNKTTTIDDVCNTISTTTNLLNGSIADVYRYTLSTINNEGVWSDNLLTDKFVEIRIYN